jgi:hypothetical protein
MSFYTHDIEPSITMTFPLLVNLYTIYFLIFGNLPSYGIALLLAILGLIITSPYRKYKKKVEILRKYYNESEKSRIRGNIIVALYVILSFVIFFLVAKYHITIQNIL